jgi:hypothetical protein
MKERISNRLCSIANTLEMILAVFIGIGILLGFIDVFKYLREIYVSDIDISYDLFRNFLSYILILVVGVEFILMLLTHSIKTIGELVVFVIARKMLVYGHSMLDMVLGALAIAIIFATIRFLFPESKPEIKCKEN